MKKFFDVEIDGQVELENGKILGKLEESQISITNPDDNSGGGSSDPAVVNAKETGGFGYTEVGEKIYYAESQTVNFGDNGCGQMIKNEPEMTIEQIYNENIRQVTIVIDDENIIGDVNYDYDDDDYYVVGRYGDKTIYITDGDDGKYGCQDNSRRNTNATVGFYYVPDIIHTVDSKYLKVATVNEAGTVRKASAVAEAQGDTVTGAEFNQLLYALQSAGIVAYSYDDQ